MVDLNELTPDQIRSLAALRQIGGEKIFGVIEVFVSDCQDQLVSADNMVRIHRLQGRVEAYRDLIQAAKDAAVIDSR